MVVVEEEERGRFGSGVEESVVCVVEEWNGVGVRETIS